MLIIISQLQMKRYESGGMVWLHGLEAFPSGSLPGWIPGHSIHQFHPLAPHLRPRSDDPVLLEPAPTDLAYGNRETGSAFLQSTAKQVHASFDGYPKSYRFI